MIAVSPTGLFALTLALRGQQRVDRRRVVVARRDDERRLAVRADGIGIDAAREQLLHGRRAIVAHGDDEVLVQVGARRAARRRARRWRRTGRRARRAGSKVRRESWSWGSDLEESEEIGRWSRARPSSTGSPRSRAISSPTKRTHAGWLRLPRCGTGREIGAVGLDQHPVERHAARDVLQRDRVPERDDARERDVEAEVERARRRPPTTR